MKKRCLFPLIMLITCLCLSGIGALSARADKASDSEQMEIDDALLEFMIDHDLPVDEIPWKMILLVLVLMLDVLIVLVLIRHWRKNVQRKRMNDSTMVGDFESEFSDIEAELKANLKLKQEDIEYLRSIGYFDPDKN